MNGFVVVDLSLKYTVNRRANRWSTEYNSIFTIILSVSYNFICFTVCFFGNDFSLLHLCKAYRERRRD